MLSLFSSLLPASPRAEVSRLSAAGRHAEAIALIQEKHLEGIGIEYYKLAKQMEERDPKLALRYLKTANQTLLQEIKDTPVELTDDETITKVNILVDYFARASQDFKRLTAQQNVVIMPGQKLFNHAPTSARIVPLPSDVVTAIDSAFDFNNFTK